MVLEIRKSPRNYGVYNRKKEEFYVFKVSARNISEGRM